MAAVQGIDLPDEDDNGNAKTADDVIRRAQAKAMGKTPDQMDLEEMGFGYEVEE